MLHTLKRGRHWWVCTNVDLEKWKKSLHSVSVGSRTHGTVFYGLPMQQVNHYATAPLCLMRVIFRHLLHCQRIETKKNINKTHNTTNFSGLQTPHWHTKKSYMPSRQLSSSETCMLCIPSTHIKHSQKLLFLHCPYSSFSSSSTDITEGTATEGWLGGGGGGEGNKQTVLYIILILS